MKVSDRFPTHAKDPALGPTIWVTRTSPDNEKTAGALRRLGFDALAVPVLRVEGLPEKALDEPPDAIVFTSVNGVRHHSICPALLDIPAFAVGDRTAASAAHAGYTHVVSAAGDVLDLERLIVQSLPRGSRLLHFSVHRPAGDLTGNLRRKGYLATRKPVYETRDVAVAKLLASLPAPHEINGILIHSPRWSCGEALPGTDIPAFQRHRLLHLRCSRGSFRGEARNGYSCRRTARRSLDAGAHREPLTEHRSSRVR